MQHRTETKRKLRHPEVMISEDIIRDDLSDLRSMVSRDYAVLVTGVGDAAKFHHMNNENNVSLSDRDRRLFEVFVVVTEKVIWIALNRKYMTLIGRVYICFIFHLYLLSVVIMFQLFNLVLMNLVLI